MARDASEVLLEASRKAQVAPVFLAPREMRTAHILDLA